MLKAHVNSIIKYEHKVGEYVLRHRHEVYELVYYARGEGLLTIEGDGYSYQEGTITITKKGVIHDETTKVYTKCIIALFELDEEIDDDFILVNLNDKDLVEVNHIFHQIFAEETADLPYKKKLINNYFNVILTYIFREKYAYQAEEKSYLSLNKRAKAFIKENYKQNIDFALLAKSYGYSYSRFRHIFKEENNISLNSYLINYRLDMAKVFLQNKKYSVKEVGYQVGFKSPSYFNASFIKKFHLTPLEFRRSIKDVVGVGVAKLKGLETIIFDTDLGYDCDDVGALALLNIFKNRNFIDLKAIIHSAKNNQEADKAIYAINKYYGNKDIPIGLSNISNPTLNQLKINPYQAALIDEFYHGENIIKHDSLDLLIKTLINAEDQSITILITGFLTNVVALMKTIKVSDNLSGSDLIKKKVSRFVIMGGAFKTSQPEFNLLSDLNASIYFFQHVETPTYLLDYDTGVTIFTGQNMIDSVNKNPIGVSYSICNGKARESWDPLTALFAINHDDHLFTLSKSGNVEIDQEGYSTFQEDKNGFVRLILLRETPQMVEKIINKYWEKNK